MDELAAAMLASTSSQDSPSTDEFLDTNSSNQATDLDENRSRKGLRDRFNVLKGKTNLQDRLVEKLLQQVLPIEPNGTETETPNLDATLDVDEVLARRPNFNITTMSNNFRRFNSRIGVVFRFQVRMIRLLCWRKPCHTLSFLAVYTFVCLDPHLLVLLPVAGLLIGVLIPSFIARHPPVVPQHPGQSSQLLQSQQYGAASMDYSPRGPPLAPARTVKPVKELSRDFFRNMRDLQNTMDDFSTAHDSIIALLVPPTNFSDEALSSTVFLLLFVAFLFMSIAAHLVPWRYAALVAGWTAVCSLNPSLKRMVVGATATHAPSLVEGGKNPVQMLNDAQAAFIDFAKSDMVLDSAPETREVEIFELQRRGATEAEEWEPWLFTSNPYDPLSASRIAGERPKGARFFEDVQPPVGWEWSEKKWALDLWSREWVEERIITAVEVETEGERWVYDMPSSYDAQGREGEPVIDHSSERPPTRPSWARPSWEERLEGEHVGRRGTWRRRRWVRLVKRAVLQSFTT